jgi:hypothetical protein
MDRRGGACGIFGFLITGKSYSSLFDSPLDKLGVSTLFLFDISRLDSEGRVFE